MIVQGIDLNSYFRTQSSLPNIVFSDLKRYNYIVTFDSAFAGLQMPFFDFFSIFLDGVNEDNFYISYLDSKLFVGKRNELTFNIKIGDRKSWSEILGISDQSLANFGYYLFQINNPILFTHTNSINCYFDRVLDFGIINSDFEIDFSKFDIDILESIFLIDDKELIDFLRFRREGDYLNFYKELMNNYKFIFPNF